MMKPKNLLQTKQLVGWDKGTPNYTVIKTTSDKPENKDKKQPDFSMLARLSDDGLYKPETNLNRVDNQMIDGKNASLFQGSIDSGFKVKIWVDKETGHPLQRIDEISIPFVTDSVQTTRFALDAEGRNLPTSTNIKVVVKIPFKSGKAETIPN